MPIVTTIAGASAVGKKLGVDKTIGKFFGGLFGGGDKCKGCEFVGSSAKSRENLKSTARGLAESIKAKLNDTRWILSVNDAINTLEKVEPNLNRSTENAAQALKGLIESMQKLLAKPSTGRSLKDTIQAARDIVEGKPTKNELFSTDSNIGRQGFNAVNISSGIGGSNSALASFIPTGNNTSSFVIPIIVVGVVLYFIFLKK